MKFMHPFSFFIFIFTMNVCNAQDYLNPYNGFAKGDTIYAFSDNIPMFSGPNTMSKLVTEIRLNQPITIASDREQDFSVQYNPNEFLHVSFKGKKGFVQRKYLAAKQLNHAPSHTIMLFQFALNADHRYDLQYREYHQNELVQSAVLPLSGFSCDVYLEDIHGLDSVTAFLVVDHFAEACGENGGNDYYVWNPRELALMAELREVGDGGVYYLTERLIFPNDPGGIEDKIIFESEEENVFDEETEWISMLHTRRVYQWVYGNVFPVFDKNLNDEN